MSRDVNLKELERKAFLFYHQDGLLDIFLGLTILLFGVKVGSGDPFGVIIILYLIYLFLWAAAKRAITIPRIGYVKFRRSPQTAKIGLATTIVVFPILLLGALVLYGYVSLQPDWMAWLEEYVMLGVGVVMAVFIGASAFLLGIRRLYGYAALTAIVLVGGYVLSVPEPPLQIMALGVLILLSGLVTLARFLRDYPIPTVPVEEGGDGS